MCSCLLADSVMAIDLTLEESPFDLTHGPWGLLSLDAAVIWPRALKCLDPPG